MHGREDAASAALHLDDLLNRQQLAMDKQLKYLEDSRAAFRVLSEHLMPWSELLPSRSVDLAQVEPQCNKATQLIEQAEKEVAVFTRGFTLNPAILRALQRGVRVQMLYPNTIRTAPGSLKSAAHLTESGSEVRTAPSLPLLMIIVDRSWVRLSTDHEGKSSGRGTDHTCRRTVTALTALFDTHWALGKELGSHAGQGAEEITQQEKAVLAMLSKGCTDEVIGKHLGVSCRTVRRVVANLMKRLSANSRFQAGVHAVYKKWIPTQE